MSELEVPISAAVEKLTGFAGTDLADLCEATEAAIQEGGGFGWVKVPRRDTVEKYWQGALLVPGRTVFVARLDGVICGSVQLVRPPRNNEAQEFSAQVMSAFIVPWARGHGLARRLVMAVEDHAAANGIEILNLDIRETQEIAISLFESLDYLRWGSHPAYARIAGVIVKGYYYYKRLPSSLAAPQPEPDRA